MCISSCITIPCQEKVDVAIHDRLRAHLKNK
jgi:hypothetical protein